MSVAFFDGRKAAQEFAIDSARHLEHFASGALGRLLI